MKLYVPIIVLFLSLMIPGVVLSATYEVVITDSGFQPSALHISVGDTVEWVNRGTSLHSATGGLNGEANGSFDSDLINPGVSFKQTFTAAGQASYFDKSNGVLSIGV